MTPLLTFLQSPAATEPSANEGWAVFPFVIGVAVGALILGYLLFRFFGGKAGGAVTDQNAPHLTNRERQEAERRGGFPDPAQSTRAAHDRDCEPVRRDVA